ncbi:hypothetical protein [Streptomyces triculaminicus]|nr:hypothetical protein [Streptomyces triculaminicus]
MRIIDPDVIRIQAGTREELQQIGQAVRHAEALRPDRHPSAARW